MTTSAIVSVQEYLTTVYEPDVDYVDGELEDRNVGEFDHSMLQFEIAKWFDSHAKEWGIRSVIEQRTRVAPTCYRVPDVSVFRRSTPIEQVFTSPQLIALEVLSPEDRHSRIERKVKNYLEFGVQQVWIVDPVARKGWDLSNGDWVRKGRFEVPGSPIYLSLSELFAKLDEDLA